MTDGRPPPVLPEPIPCLRSVAIAVQQRERNERQAPLFPEQVEHLGHAVVEVTLTVVRGIADE